MGFHCIRLGSSSAPRVLSNENRKRDGKRLCGFGGCPLLLSGPVLFTPLVIFHDRVDGPVAIRREFSLLVDIFLFLSI